MERQTCSFAYAGTYGHECGSPATLVGLKPSENTKSGTFYALRCDKCSKVEGGENSAITRFEVFDHNKHINGWK